MRWLYLISVWLHVIAAITWVGGIVFLIVVVVPWLRAGRQEIAGRFIRETGRRFMPVAWGAFGLLLATGSFNLWVRGVRPENFVDTEWLATPFGRAVWLKITLFGAILLVSGVHDFVVGRRAAIAMEHEPHSASAMALRRFASLLGRLNALLALAILLVAVMLVRGGIGL